jgi:hypothetical protein
MKTNILLLFVTLMLVFSVGCSLTGNSTDIKSPGKCLAIPITQTRSAKNVDAGTYTINSARAVMFILKKHWRKPNH